MDRQKLRDLAIEALKYNDLGKWTRPAPGLYPHQWLWDSCFIAIGLAHVDPQRAQQELRSLFRGQWDNGMLPNMIYDGGRHGYHLPNDIWDSKVSPHSPRGLNTSGITQPPMLAEAITRVGAQLKPAARQEFYRTCWPHLLAYHQWLYRERDADGDGLIALLHPWESGMDNTPPWMLELTKHEQPLWIRLIHFTRLTGLVERFRPDFRAVPGEERATTLDVLMLYHVVRRLRGKQYDSQLLLKPGHRYAMYDLFFNCILARANQHLQDIASELDEALPTALTQSMRRTGRALEKLWHEGDQRYYSRSLTTGKAVRQTTIATLMPLYAGTITKARAEELVKLMKDVHHFGPAFPVPSVPLSSDYFNHRRYWQGPTWINTNWLLIDGLERYGFKAEAAHLREKSLDLVERSGFHEYFSPVDGYGAGVQPFSWTAALTIDLLAHKPDPKES